jgi:hypothetical protein
MSRDISILSRRTPGSSALRMDFTAREADDWEQAAQMFVNLFLTDAGSVPSDPGRGTTFLMDLRAGRIYSDMLLKANFDFAARDVFAYLSLRGRNADAKLAGVNLTRWEIGGGAVKLWVELLSSDGAILRCELPVRI